MARRVLNGKTVVITGGAGGIGSALARTFAQRGAQVAIGDLDEAAAALTAHGVGCGAISGRLDVTDDTSLREFLIRVENELGPLDVMVNNAGVLEARRFVDESPEATRRQVEVNLIGTLLSTRAAIHLMAPRRAGHVVNIASIAGVSPIPGAATYTATKHAVVGLTDTVRLEMHGSGIRFTTVLPTHVRTPMTRGIPENRFAPVIDAQQVADAVVDAVQTGRRDVFVPGRMAALRTARVLVPKTVLGWAVRAIGAEVAP